MNKFIAIGRLTRDAELRKTTNGKSVVSFTIALDKYNPNGENKADFIPVVAWEKVAENVCNYTHKGSLVAIDGSMQSRTYQAQDGTNRTVIECLAYTVTFLEKKSESQHAYTVNYNQPEQQEPVEIKSDDLPF